MTQVIIVGLNFFVQASWGGGNTATNMHANVDC